MNYKELVATLTPDMIHRFRSAVELGRWPDGSAVSAEQREHCMQAIIAYEEVNLAPEERVGYIDTKGKGQSRPGAAQEQPLRFRDENKGDDQ